MGVSIACLFISVTFFAVALFSSTLAETTYRVMQEQGTTLSDKHRTMLAEQVLWVAFSSLASLLGKSLISTVFFSDGVVSLMHKFHWGELSDSLHFVMSRARGVNDIHGLFAEASERLPGSDLESCKPEQLEGDNGS